MSMPVRGWIKLYNAPSSHYFVNGMSLCGTWFTLRHDYDDNPDRDREDNNCKKCRAKLAGSKYRPKVSDGE